GVAEFGGHGQVAVHAEDGQIGQRIRADHLERRLGTVGERRFAVPRTTDDVRVGDQVVVVEHHGRPAAAQQLHAGDLRGEPTRHGGDHAGVGVQGVFVRPAGVRHDDHLQLRLHRYNVLPGGRMPGLCGVRPQRAGRNFAVAVTRSRLRFLVAGVPAQPGHAPAVALDHLLRRAGVPADQPVQVDVAVQVIGLVLQAAGEETLALDLDRLTVEVETGDFRPRRPAGRERLTGYGQAAFPVVVRVRHAFRPFRGLQHGVDHQALTPLAELFVRAVVDEDAQIDAD